MTENGTACFYSCASRVGTSLNSSQYASIGPQILRFKGPESDQRDSVLTSTESSCSPEGDQLNAEQELADA